MKPATFSYVAAQSKEHALAVLAEHGDEAKVIAGGQSLGPLLNMRLATPSVLVDINGVQELTGRHTHADGSLRIGALARHRELETGLDVATGWPLLSQAIPFIGHRAIRNRGTIGGSLAHADPAAELPAVVTALSATIVLESRRGVRMIAAQDFFESYFTCAVDADELVTEVRLPGAQSHQGSAWVEFAPRHGDYGYVGVAAVVVLGADRTCSSVRVVYSGIGATPVEFAAESLLGAPVGDLDDIDADARVTAAALEAAHTIQPGGDLVAPPEYKKRLVFQLTHQALSEAIRRAVP
jgi:carbon-monoxide dehydrogenase medium subunit